MTEFPRVGLFSKGYDCAQVDAFFEDARRAYEGGVPPEQFSAEQVRLATLELKIVRIPLRPRVRQHGTTVSPTARRPFTRVFSVLVASASRTRRRDAATPARKSMTCWIVSRRTSTRPGS